MPAGRHAQLRLLREVVGLDLVEQRGDLAAATEHATRLAAMTEADGSERSDIGLEYRARALISLGSAQFWAGGIQDAARHLERGVALAHQIGQPYLEFIGLAYQAVASLSAPFSPAAERATRAVELAEEHGWTDVSGLGLACAALGNIAVGRGRLEEAESWVLRAERTFRADAHPGPGVLLHDVRGVLELARHRYPEALAAFEAAERLGRRLVSAQYSAAMTEALMVFALLRLGETGRARGLLAGLDDHQREQPEIRIVSADLSLTEGDPDAALSTLASVLDAEISGDGPVPTHGSAMLGFAFMLEAIARDTLGDQDGVAVALEHALDLAEPDGDLRSFFFYPAAQLLERHARHHNTHASLVAEIQHLLAGATPTSGAATPQPLIEPLSDAELRVLRYLPTNLTAPEVARELYVSANTVKTHTRNLYAKLDAHRRTEAVERARALGLLAPSGAGRTRPAKTATP